MKLHSLLAAVGFALVAQAHAQTWPTKPVQIVVPATPGGTIDPLARIIGEALHHAFGQPFIIDNRPGAAGNIGLTKLAKSEPDGYTIGIAASSMLAINPHLYKAPGYDALKDLQPIALVSEVQNILVVNRNFPASNFREFVDYAKKHPGKINFGSSGNGSSMHLSGELFKSLTGTNMQHVPYSNVGEGTKDLMAGRIEAMFQLIPGIQGQIKAGTVKPIVLLSRQRSKLYPDLPTTGESGVPELQSSVWFGLVAPANTPKPIIERISNEIAKLQQDPNFLKRIESMGNDPLPGGSAEFTRLLVKETEKWRQIVKTAGVVAE